MRKIIRASSPAQFIVALCSFFSIPSFKYKAPFLYGGMLADKDHQNESFNRKSPGRLHPLKKIYKLSAQSFSFSPFELLHFYVIIYFRQFPPLI
jgi:hypothetical protein